MGTVDSALGTALPFVHSSLISQALLFYTNALTENDAKLQQAACVALKHLRVSSTCSAGWWRRLLVGKVSSFQNFSTGTKKKKKKITVSKKGAKELVWEEQP